jgi:hypothetical protein
MVNAKRREKEKQKKQTKKENEIKVEKQKADPIYQRQLDVAKYQGQAEKLYKEKE